MEGIESQRAPWLAWVNTLESSCQKELGVSSIQIREAATMVFDVSKPKVCYFDYPRCYPGKDSGRKNETNERSPPRGFHPERNSQKKTGECCGLEIFDAKIIACDASWMT